MGGTPYEVMLGTDSIYRDRSVDILENSNRRDDSK